MHKQPTALLANTSILVSKQEHSVLVNPQQNLITQPDIIAVKLTSNIGQHVEQEENQILQYVNKISGRDSAKQKQFRTKLANYYGEVCVVSNCKLALQAAHIQPVHKEENYDLGNGIFLRADLHFLFDQHEWSINPKTFAIELGKAMQKEDCFKQLHGNIIANFDLDLQEKLKQTLKSEYMQDRFNEFQVKNPKLIEE